MKTRLGTSIVCGMSLMLFSAAAQAEVSIGANVEIDTDYISNSGGSSDDQHAQGGRVKVDFSGMTEGTAGYVKGVGQIVLNDEGDTGVDDMYVRLGQEKWGVQLGRFEGMDLFSKGVDTIHNVLGNTNFYNANAARGRISDAGQIMFDFSPSDRVKFELNTVYGLDDPFEGYRPAIHVKVTDDFNISAGYDYLEDGDSETKGVGIYARYATDVFALKMNVAKGEKETNGVQDWENTSYNINLESGVFAVGYTQSEDDGGDKASTVYGNYSMPNLLGVKNATGKLGFSAAQADSAAEDEFALRYRVFYEF